jgi:hypothetical protein
MLAFMTVINESLYDLHGNCVLYNPISSEIGIFLIEEITSSVKWHGFLEDSHAIDMEELVKVL